MAGLRHGYGRTTSDHALDGFLSDGRPGGACIRPRIELPNRRNTSVRSASTGRFLAISTAVLILGSGGVLALHLLTSSGAEPVAVASAPVASPRAGGPVTIDPRDPALKAATILGAPARSAEPARPAATAQPGATVQAAGSVTAVPTTTAPTTTARRPAEAGPTAADFARPAFLEPAAPRTLAADADGPDAGAAPKGPAMAYANEPSGAARDLPFPTRRPAETARATPSATPSEAGDTRLVRAINMRSAPRRGADTVAVLSAGTKVTLVSCSSWCEIEVGDKRGYIYKSAVGR